MKAPLAVPLLGIALLAGCTGEGGGTVGSVLPAASAPEVADSGQPISTDAPPRLNPSDSPGTAPDGMTWIPGGEFTMGSEDPSMPDARPLVRVSVDGVWMDKTEVTNEQFQTFVKATGYVTIAERKPRAEEFPGAPAENLLAGAVVFAAPPAAVPLDDHYRW